MATNTTPAFPQSRRDPRQVPNTLKMIMNWNDAGVTTGEAFPFSLPQSAFITDVKVEVVTAFNAATTNTLTVGTNSSSYNNIVATADVNLGATGVTSVSRGWGRSIANAADTTPFVTYTQTGTSATTGQAIIVITYEGGWSS